MKIFLCVLLALGIVSGIGFWLFHNLVGKENPEYILKLMDEKAKDGKIAMAINFNDENMVSVNANSELPLASTMKIVVAIEFARQAAEGKLDPNQEVSLRELEHFYIPNTDGGAHPAWIKSLDASKKSDSAVSLYEVAKGMIGYSSNANTDYLMDVLGLENINNLLNDLELTTHDPLYPIVGALYIPLQLLHEEQVTKDFLLDELQGMEMNEYRERAITISKEWKANPLSSEKKEEMVKNLGMDIQRVWSDRLPGSSANDYMVIMEKLNNKEYFSEDVHRYLDPIMEQLMENSANQQWLEHAGQKGGSTAFVLTMAMYATDKHGNKTEMVFLADDLSRLQQQKLSRNLNSFQLRILREEAFREKVKEELAN